MKKLILVAIAIASFTISQAQKVGGGLEAGFNYSWLGTDSKKASVEKGNIGFTFGAFLDLNMSDNFTFTTGLNMVQYGGNIKYVDAINLTWDDAKYTVAPDGIVKYKINYLEFPISLKGKTQEIGYITYFGRLGANPAIAIKTRAEVEGIVVDESLVVQTDLTDLNIKENINFFNVGWHVGGGIEYSLGGSTAVIAEVMYSQNFLNIVKDNVTGISGNNVGINSSMIILKAGIKF
ncbi:MAG: PorT family protein [Bacteroidales bacterium]|nr:PorT family protein [Bacteroidales bacterium]